MSTQVEAAIKALAKIEADPAKFQAFCKLNQELAAVAEADEAKAEALDQKLADLLQSIGPDVVAAWELADEIDPESADGKALAAAMDALEEKCGD